MTFGTGLAQELHGSSMKGTYKEVDFQFQINEVLEHIQCVHLHSIILTNKES